MRNKEKESGWFENPDQTGKAPEHVAASQRGKSKNVLRQAMVKEPEKEEEHQISFKTRECKLEVLAEYVESHGLELGVSEDEEEGMLKVIAPNEEKLTDLQDFLNEKQILKDEPEGESEEEED